MAENKPKNWDEKWEKNVETGVSRHRWDPGMMGPAMENYRDMPGKDEQEAFLKGLPEFLKDASEKGKRLADFRTEIDRQVRREAGEKPGEAVWFDQVQFYKEVEEVLKMERKKEAENTQITPMADPNTPLDSEGKPMTVPLESTLTWKLMHWLFGEKLPKEVRKLGNGKKLEATLREIYANYDEIDELNAEIFMMKNSLSDLEHKLVEKEGTDEEADIRDTITEQQKIIREAMQERAGVLAKKTTPKEILSAKLMNAVKKALMEESLIINKKFGTKIARLFRERQVLITQSTRYSHETPDQFAKKMEIQGKIETIDIQLDKLKTELIKYKSKKPIFLFERLVGVKSIPLVERFGQSSTLDFTYEGEMEKQGSTT